LEDQQKIMMLRAHGLLDDSELVDFIRMASATGSGGASGLLQQYERMLMDYENGDDDDDEDDDDVGHQQHMYDRAELAQLEHIRAMAM
jgi:hypothetical protein